MLQYYLKGIVPDKLKLWLHLKKINDIGYFNKLRTTFRIMNEVYELLTSLGYSLDWETVMADIGSADRILYIGYVLIRCNNKLKIQ